MTNVRGLLTNFDNDTFMNEDEDLQMHVGTLLLYFIWPFSNE